MERKIEVKNNNYETLPFGLISRNKENLIAIPLKNIEIEIKLISNLSIVTYH